MGLFLLFGTRRVTRQDILFMESLGLMEGGRAMPCQPRVFLARYQVDWLLAVW